MREDPLRTTLVIRLGSVPLLSRSALICLSFLTLATISLWSQEATGGAPGIAWRVRGPWRVDGISAPILDGDAVQPGSLLRPDESAHNQSITVLLPDGQRFLFECFTVEDCARGFRVPWLYRRPEPLAVDLLARVRVELAGGNRDLSTGPGFEHMAHLPRNEVITVLGLNNRVDVGGLVKSLSNGRYTYDLRSLDTAFPRQSHLDIEKNEPAITLALPSSGLYVLTITDELNKPRIDLFIAAVTPTQAKRVEKPFADAEALMKEWNVYYQGWPVHDFKRAYLESLIMGEKPPGERKRESKPTSNAGMSGGPGDAAEGRAGVTSEPTFGPKPGLFEGDTAVTLRCDTPGAVMHFTVDGSQPVASSSVYLAPIMVQGTELTIKSFASMAGRKDSAVVTGIFRIQE